MNPDALSYLSNLDRFSAIEERELSLLASMCTVRDVPAGTTVVNRADKGSGLLLLVAGRVISLQKVGVGGNVRHYVVSAPSLVGPTRLGATTDGFFDFVAQSDCVILSIDREDFRAIERANAPISRAMLVCVYTEMARYVATAEDYLMGLYQSPGQTKKRLEELTLAT
jgi:CRP-like cAMP-binding protein